MRSPFSRGFVLTMALSAIAIATLPPAPGQPSAQWLGCLMCGDHGTADMLLNVILFVPLGAALALYGNSTARSAGYGVLLSAMIEVAQLYIPGRDFSLGDVVANAAGAALGAMLVRTAPVWVLPYPGIASRLSRAATVAAVGLCVLTGLLLTPAAPISQYYGMWTPNLGHLQWYRGRVRNAMISGVRVAPGPIADSRRVCELLLAASGFSLRVHAIAGPRPSALAPLFAIYDEAHREIVLLGIDRDDLTFRISTRAAAVHLDRPDIRVAKAMRSFTAGDTLDITVTRRGAGDYRIGLNSRSYAKLGFSVGGGWALLLYPESLPAWLKAALDALWVGALFVPAGLWMRNRGDGLWAGGGALLGVLGTPALMPLVATPAVQCIAAAVGLAAGAGLHAVISRRLSPTPPPEAMAAASARTHRSMRE